MYLNHTAKCGNKIIFENGGFTIIEVLIAMAIFAIGILGVSKMQLHAISGNTSSRGMTEATTLGQQQIECLISLPYEHNLLSDTNGDANAGLDEISAPDHLPVDPPVCNIDLNDPVHDLYDLYDIFWNVAVDYPIEDTKTIRVIVRWQHSRFAVKQIAFDTVKVSM